MGRVSELAVNIASYYIILLIFSSSLRCKLPVDAVVKSDGKEWIFIAIDSVSPGEGKDGIAFRMMEVITGVSDLGYIEIKPVEEISADAKVVIKNPFFILSKAKEGEGEEE